MDNFAVTRCWRRVPLGISFGPPNKVSSFAAGPLCESGLSFPKAFANPNEVTRRALEKAKGSPCDNAAASGNLPCVKLVPKFRNGEGRCRIQNLRIR